MKKGNCTDLSADLWKRKNRLPGILVLIIGLLITAASAQTPEKFETLHTRYDFINTVEKRVIKSFIFKEDLIKRVTPPRIILNTESLVAKAEMIDTVYYFYAGNLLIKQYNVMMVAKDDK